VEIEVEYGIMRVPANLILTVEQDTPEVIAAREEEKAQDKEHAAMMRAEGKVLYKGKWIDEAEKEEIETKLAAEKKKKDEEKAAAKKKKDEELAKRKEDLRKQAEEEQKRREQIAAQNGGRYDERAERFNRSRNRDENGNPVNNTNTNNYTNNNRTQNDYSRNRTR
jgi:aspartate beta-hydroxylase